VKKPQKKLPKQKKKQDIKALFNSIDVNTTNKNSATKAANSNE
jgi:hypothetical protein